MKRIELYLSATPKKGSGLKKMPPNLPPNQNTKPLQVNTSKGFINLSCCRGRDRTSTRQLAIAQSSVVDPGRNYIAIKPALHYVYPVILTPETRGHVCQKFHHPTIFIRTNRIQI